MWCKLIPDKDLVAMSAILDTHNYACFIRFTDGDRLMSSWLASPSIYPV